MVESHGQQSVQGYSVLEDDMDEQLLSPFIYLAQVQGKGVRGKLAKGFNKWLNIPDEKLEAILEIVQMLHNASLLIDDIEDNSILRRGNPVAHQIFGIPSTLNAGNFAYFKALEKTLQLGHPLAVNVFAAQLVELHRGQGRDIFWRDTYTCPTEEEYMQMVIQKTGGLFGLAVYLMQLFAEKSFNFTPLLNDLGLFFQIRDDLANLTSSEYEVNKSYCDDLSEGKFSFPLIHAIKQNSEDQVMNIIRRRTQDKNVKKYCVEYLEKAGSFEYTKKTLAKLSENISSQISSLGGNPYLEQLVVELSNFNK